MKNQIQEVFHFLQESRGADGRASPIVGQLASQYYMIFITPRCGSTFLTHALANTHLMGNPDEWFNPESVRYVIGSHGITDIETYVQFVISMNQSSNGVFGVQFAWPYFQFLSELVDLTKVFGDRPQWFFMRRRNLVAQAISLYVANKTGIFHSYQLTEENKKNSAAVDYDRKAIRTSVEIILAQEIAIAAYQKEKNLSAVELFYEDVIRDVAKTINLFRNVLQVATIPEEVYMANPIRRMPAGNKADFEIRFRLEEERFLESIREKRPPVWMEAQEA